MDSACTICFNDHDLLIACRKCKKNGWCSECDAKMEKCPMCRTPFRNTIEIDLSRYVSVGDEYYEVEAVVDHRVQLGQLQYLIHWAGEHDDDGDEYTWESAERALEDIPEMIQEYWANK